MTKRNIIIALYLTLLLCLTASQAGAEAEAGRNIGHKGIAQYIQRMERAYKALSGYTSVFYQQLAYDGELGPLQTISLTFQKPFRVYMKWIKKPHLGREVIYAPDMHDGRVWAHNGSFPDLTLCLDPVVLETIASSRHMIKDVGIGSLIKLVKDNYLRSLANPQDHVRFVDRGVLDVHGQPTRCVESIMPADPDSGYYGHRAKLFIDEQLDLPIKVIIWDHQNRLYEIFIYTKIKLNPQLGPRVFDPDNPEYAF